MFKGVTWVTRRWAEGLNEGLDMFPYDYLMIATRGEQTMAVVFSK